MSVSVDFPPTPDIRDRLIIGLDIPTIGQARDIVDRIGDAGSFYKIGYQLAFSGGLELARDLVAEGKKVFIDLKLHDIGNTVEHGVRAIAAIGATFLTVHAYPQTMRAAVAGRAGSSLKILAVTVLTSYDEKDLIDAGYMPGKVEDLVASRAVQAREAGVDGIVCAATEASRIRGLVGPNRLIVTPGIRPTGAAAGDQKRILTPSEAVRNGADHLVVGRPIVAAPDPRAATEMILAEISAAAEA